MTWNTRRLFFVVAHGAMQIEPGAIPISTKSPKCDVAVIAGNDLALVPACSARVATHQLFLLAFTALTVHPEAAPSTVDTLYVRQQSLSATSDSQNHTPLPPSFILQQLQHSYAQSAPPPLSIPSQ